MVILCLYMRERMMLQAKNFIDWFGDSIYEKIFDFQRESEKNLLAKKGEDNQITVPRKNLINEIQKLIKNS